MAPSGRDATLHPGTTPPAATPIRNFCKLGVRISRSRRSREKKTLEACLPLAKPKTRRTAQAHQGNQEAVDLRGHSRALSRPCLPETDFLSLSSNMITSGHTEESKRYGPLPSLRAAVRRTPTEKTCLPRRALEFLGQLSFDSRVRATCNFFRGARFPSCLHFSLFLKKRRKP